MPLERLRFSGVGPFDEIEMTFDNQVNVFVGPNNSGKSVTLMVLGEVLVFPFSIPNKLVTSSKATWAASFHLNGRAKVFKGIMPVTRMYGELGPKKRMEWDKYWREYAGLLEDIGYTAFVPALRESTDFRASGPIVKSAKKRQSQSHYSWPESPLDD
jgi:hypothetical protein